MGGTNCDQPARQQSVKARHGKDNARTWARAVRQPVRQPAAMACSHISFFAYLLAITLCTFILFEVFRPDLLLVGNVTIDVLETKGSRYEAPGGKRVS